MKKGLFAILTILYMAVSSGVAMDIHYCMGKKSGFDLYGKDNDVCGKCGMKHKKGCCGDEHKFYKLSDSHNNVFNTINFNAGSVAIITQHINYNLQTLIAINAKAITDYSPPEYTLPPARILNGSFRI